MRSSRWIFVDFLRFVAVLLMLQGHTFDAVLSYEIRAEGWYRIHAFWHGFTAPLFLFGSGLAFGIATFRKWEGHIGWSPALAKRLRRFSLLLVIGYALHLPYFSLSRVVNDLTPEQWSAFLQSDALHVIALALIVAQMSVFLLKDRKRVALFLGIGSAAIILAAPFLWSAPLEGVLPAGFVAYLNSSTGSIFPFFPWSAYLFLGVVTAYAMKPWQSAEPDRNRVAMVAAAGAVLLIVSQAAQLVPLTIFPEGTAWNARPDVLMGKAGAIMLFLAALYQLELVIRNVLSTRGQSSSQVLNAVTVMGQESLVIYVVHLLILYGSVLAAGLNRSVGRTLDVPGSLAVFGVLFLAMLLLAWAWQFMKRHRVEVLKTVQWSLGLSLAAVFLISPS